MNRTEFAKIDEPVKQWNAMRALTIHVLEEHIMAELSIRVALKICTKCGCEKTVSEFYKDKKNKDGIGSQCKLCKNISCDAYHSANAERIKEYQAAWRDANPEKVKAATASWYAVNTERKKKTNAAWHAANSERVKEKSAAYYVSNFERCRAVQSAWKVANPAATRIHNQNRRAQKIETGGKLSPGLAAKLFKLQKGKCPCCKQPLGDNYHMDHVIPLALGGSNEDSNIQLLRQRCNNQKHAKHPVDFMQERGFLL